MSRLLLVSCIAVLLLGAACGKPPSATPDEIRARGQLVVGTEPEFWPMEYATPDGGYAGFDIDLAEALAGELGVELRLETLPFTSLIPALETGKIDMILSGMTATEERAKQVLFSDTYFLTGLCLLLNRETTEGVASHADLDGEKWRIVVKTGTTGDFAVQRLMPKAKRTSLPKEADCASEVVTGRADAFVYDQLSILKHHRNNPETTRAILDRFTEEPYSAAFRPADTELHAFFNALLRKMREDGRYDALAKKHFPEVAGDAEGD